MSTQPPPEEAGAPAADTPADPAAPVVDGDVQETATQPAPDTESVPGSESDAPPSGEAEPVVDPATVEPTAEAPVESKEPKPVPEPPPYRLPVYDLDLALAPVRRVAAWASTDVQRRAAALPYLEATVARWVGEASRLDLPDPLRNEIREMATVVDGYDGAEPSERADRLAALHQITARVDAMLGLPLPRHRIRRPDKPRMPNFQVEETPQQDQAPRSEEAVEKAAKPEAKSKREDSDRPLKRGRGRRRSEGPPPPLPPLWNRRMGTPIGDLPVPANVVEALADIGCTHVRDLLSLPPESTRRLRPIHGAGRPLDPEAEQVAVGGRVTRRVTVLRPDGGRDVKVGLKGAGNLEVTWGGDDPGLEALGGVEALPPGERLVLVGRAEQVEGPDGEVWVLRDAERATDDGKGGVQMRSYGISGVSDVRLRGLLARLLAMDPQIRDMLPSAVSSRFGVVTTGDAIRHLHHGHLEKARQRMAFDEALLVQLGLTIPPRRRHRDRGISITPVHGLAARIAETHEVMLDDDRQAALESIKRDLRSTTPMSRVLVGEERAGRGELALLAIAAVAENKVQVAHICTDSALAEQRYLFSANLLREGGLVTRFVEGEASSAIEDALSRGSIHVVFGGPDLITAPYRRLGLIVVESDRPSPEIIEALAGLKQPRPHVLFMPRDNIGTLAALLDYPSATVTRVPGRPAAPQVHLHSGEDRAGVYTQVAEAAAQGQQSLVLFPLVRGADALELRDAWRLVQALQEDALGECRVALYHGAMPRDERLRVWEDFQRRRADVLVCTAPVEDAPTIPSAGWIVLEQAERFGLQRQRRIRGMLRPEDGRPVIHAVCAGSLDDAQEALAGLLDKRPAARRSDEEFPEDAKEALPSLRWLDPVKDRELVWQARQLAHEIVRPDPRLRSGWVVEVGRELRGRWSALYPDDSRPVPLDRIEQRAEGSESGDGERKRRRRRRRKKK